MKENFIQDLFSLEGKVALVTGAGRGIGQVIARDLARAGADIAIFSRSGAAESVKLIESEGGRALDIIADCTKEDQVRAGIQKILAEYGHLDVVVNNAGVCYHKDIFEATVEEFRECLDINLTGEYIVAREAARVMIEKNIAGSIINIASMSAYADVDRSGLCGAGAAGSLGTAVPDAPHGEAGGARRSDHLAGIRRFSLCERYRHPDRRPVYGSLRQAQQRLVQPGKR